MQPDFRRVPGQPNDRVQDDPGEPGDLPPPAPRATDGDERRRHEPGEDQPDGAFGQRGEAAVQEEPEIIRPPACLVGAEKRVRRQQHPREEHRVEHREPRLDKHVERDRRDRAGEQPHARTEQRAADQNRRVDGHHAEHARPEPHGELAEAHRARGQRGQPHVERRVHVPRRAVDVERDPVASLEDLTRDLRVLRLVLIPERACAEPVERQNRDAGEQRRGPQALARPTFAIDSARRGLRRRAGPAGRHALNLSTRYCAIADDPPGPP